MWNKCCIKRKISFFRSIIGAILVLVLTTSCSGIILGFMPGDAYYHSLLTETWLESLKNDNDCIPVSYVYVPLSGGLGGYAGFRHLQIVGENKACVSNLYTVYRKLREYEPKIVRIERDDNGNRKDIEINGFHMFIYNRDVIWSMQRLALKYNENWCDLPRNALEGDSLRRIGICHSKAIYYTTFVPSYKAIVHDWQYAKDFKGLQVSIPNKVSWGVTGPPIDEAIVAQIDNIQFVILADREFRDYFQQSPEVDFLAVTSDGINVYSWKDQEVIKKDWKETIYGGHNPIWDDLQDEKRKNN